MSDFQFDVNQPSVSDEIFDDDDDDDAESDGTPRITIPAKINSYKQPHSETPCFNPISSSQDTSIDIIELSDSELPQIDVSARARLLSKRYS